MRHREMRRKCGAAISLRGGPGARLTGVVDRVNLEEFPAAVLAVCGWSGSGKTTVLEAVLPRLAASGLRVPVCPLPWFAAV